MILINLIHYPFLSRFFLIRYLLKKVVNELWRMSYHEANYILLALSDINLGPQSLLGTNEEKLHQYLSTLQEPFYSLVDSNNVVIYPNSQNNSDSHWKRFIRLVSFNGQLLPMRKRDVPVVIYGFGMPFTAFFARKRALVVNASNNTYALRIVQIRKTMMIFFKTILALFYFSFFYKRLLREWQDFALLASKEDFWLKKFSSNGKNVL